MSQNATAYERYYLNRLRGAKMETRLFNSPYGELTLFRRPFRPRETLQAWDAADDYLLHYLSEQDLGANARILIVNDSFGSLTTALADYACTLWADSAISQLCSAENAARNGKRPPQFIPATQVPEGNFDVILYRLPKSRSLLNYQLQSLAPLCQAGAVFIGAAMARHIDQHIVAAFAKNIATVKPSLARKKARLMHLDGEILSGSAQSDTKTITLADHEMVLANRANVFSRDKLDQGSRILLDSLAKLDAPQHVADLGCGNGIIGISAAKRWPGAQFHYFDDSFLAIDSAQRNVSHNLGEARQAARFTASDCLFDYKGERFDLILCNPPFHQDHHVGDHIARQMFRDSFEHLVTDGVLCVVGNRHLGYHILLKKLFGNCETINSDSKFVVLLARKTTPSNG